VTIPAQTVTLCLTASGFHRRRGARICDARFPLGVLHRNPNLPIDEVRSPGSASSVCQMNSSRSCPRTGSARTTNALTRRSYGQRAVGSSRLQRANQLTRIRTTTRGRRCSDELAFETGACTTRGTPLRPSFSCSESLSERSWVHGWSSTSMATRYQHVTDPIRRDVARRIGGLLFAPGSDDSTDG
jgi:hypothetical protein